MPTKIAPSAGKPGDDFTLLDTSLGRLADGAVASFRDPASGSTVTAPLRTHRPHKTAQGTVPAGLTGGVTYEVSFAVNGTSYPVGTFTVGGSGDVLVAPTIDPPQGTVGMAFFVDDAMQRMRPGDQARFYLPGDDPATGTPADGATVSTNFTRLDGKVPAVPAMLHYYVAVVCPNPLEVRFQGLPFLVTG